MGWWLVIPLCSVGPDRSRPHCRLAELFVNCGSTLWTVVQRCTGIFLIQRLFREIKTTLYMVIFLQKDDYVDWTNFNKKRLQHKCFPVNIAKFLRTPILKNICQRLLLRFLLSSSFFFLINYKNTFDYLLFPVLGKMPPGKVSPGKLPPGKLPPRKIVPRKNAPGKSPHRKIPPWTFLVSFLLPLIFIFMTIFVWKWKMKNLFSFN